MQGIQGIPGKPGESIGMLGFISRHAIALTFVTLIVVTSYFFQVNANQQDKLEKQADKIEMTALALKARTEEETAVLCESAVKGWDQRYALAVVATKPIEIAPELRDDDSPAVRVLKLHVAYNNTIRAAGRAELLELGGPKPTC